MIHKTPKIKDKNLLALYSEANPGCEFCKHVTQSNSEYNPIVELHHIQGGYVLRTDELWNIIRLCKIHHFQSTYHTSVFARQYNHLNMCIKYQKGEIKKGKLIDYLISMCNDESLLDLADAIKYYKKEGVLA